MFRSSCWRRLDGASGGLLRFVSVLERCAQNRARAFRTVDNQGRLAAVLAYVRCAVVPTISGMLPLTYGPWNGDDFFDRWHDDGDEAFQILQEGFDVAPPSCEVFEHGLEDQRRREPRRPLSVVEYAHRLVQNHQPINGL